MTDVEWAAVQPLPPRAAVREVGAGSATCGRWSSRCAIHCEV
ncbi:probable remnant of a transposase gene protein [Ralstonia pseudosolanacearum GMI1000]|uniref:Probable remnant of a transposase gene protein n=1 Tax=Ralstonia nicotianae (strain ATCC BAA-1114 / GMI1000) TaxID=267608 RepID=Q8XTN3_RALN1|nr:probable remnant of a transposase gene protein [Ralstonia pseudosolanacearum GMI1000]